MQRAIAGSCTNTYLALSCIGFIASSPAHASDGAPDAADAGTQTITVIGTPDAQQASPKAIAPLINTPRSIVVVDKQVIKDTAAATLVDALRTVPGITFGAAEGGNPIGDRPFIRGYDSQGSTFLDGVRDSAAQTREVFAVEQIQVVRGSDGTLGGRGSAGGSLNILSKLPETRDFVSGSISAGNAQYRRVTGDANVHLSPTIALRIAGMWHDQDVAGRDAIWQKRWGIAPSVTVGIGTPTQITLSYYHVTSHELPDSGIPYFYVCSATLCNAPLGQSISGPAIGDITLANGTTGQFLRPCQPRFPRCQDRPAHSARAT
jgi:catecholate siderophore receptor